MEVFLGLAMAAIAALRVAARRSRGAKIVLGCVGIAFGLTGIAWAVRLTFFPTLAERLHDHGRSADAAIMLDAQDSDPPRSVTIKFDPGSGPITTTIDTTGSSDVHVPGPGDNADVRIVPSDLDIVYKPDDPHIALPSDVVSKAQHPPVTQLWWLSVGYTLAVASATGIQVIRSIRHVPLPTER